MDIKDKLITEISQNLINMAPFPNWERITFRYHQVSNWAQGFLFYFDKFGKEVWSSARNVTPFADELRQRMAEEHFGKGTWFEMKMEVTMEGKFKIEFDYDSRPEFGFEILDETFIADLKQFPRHEKFIPEWLRDVFVRSKYKFKE